MWPRERATCRTTGTTRHTRGHSPRRETAPRSLCPINAWRWMHAPGSGTGTNNALDTNSTTRTRAARKKGLPSPRYVTTICINFLAIRTVTHSGIGPHAHGTEQVVSSIPDSVVYISASADPRHELRFIKYPIT